MEFLNPSFLFGFSALAVPVLIHLFNLRRYRKEYFTNVRFLSQIQLETRKQSKLKHLLILAVRLLAIAFMVLAFSRPFIPSPLQSGRKSGHQAVSIYVDNSYSMEANSSEGKLLELAKKRASEIVAAFKPSDIFQLMTNDFEGKHSQFVSREEIQGMLSEVKISHASVSLPEIIGRMNDLFTRQKESSHTAFLISDFQKGTACFENIKTHSSVHYVMVPLESIRQDNLFIDSVWFSAPVHRPGQAVRLIVKIKNCGSEKLENVPLRLSINSTQKSVTSFTVEPAQSVEIALPYTEGDSGFQLGSLEVIDYPVIYDDIFYFSYTISDHINVLSIYGRSPNLYLQSLFTSDSVFNLSAYTANQVDYSSLSKHNIILISGIDELASGLAGELRSFLEKGGSVCIFPPEKSGAETFNTFFSSIGTSFLGRPDTMKQRVASIDIENVIFKDVFEKDAAGKITLPDNADLPHVFKYYSISGGSVNPPDVLMRLQNGLPFLTSTSVGKGTLYLCASPVEPSFTNFQQHLMFVPVMFRMAFLAQAQTSLYYIIGRNESFDLPSDSVNEKNMVSIKRWNNSFEFIPELKSSGRQVKAYFNGQISEAGWYLVNRGRKQISALAFNYDRKESDINCFNPKEIEAAVKKHNIKNITVLKPSGLPFSKKIEQLNQGFPLWKLFVILALIFVAAEILLIRLFRS